MTGVLGGGVIFVVAALLWAAVLVPSWVRRRDFQAAERNAVRLQRTLRVLAETAEVPTEVRVEATAREALAQERLLRTAQREQEAERQAKLAEARAAQVRAEMRAQQMRRKQTTAMRSARLRRPVVRRLRAATALVALISIAAVFVGVGFAVTGQGIALLGGAALGFTATIGALVLMAPGRVRHVPIAAEQAVEVALNNREDRESPIKVAESAEAAVAAHAAAQAAAAVRIERARAMARARAERPGTAMKNQPESILLHHAPRGEAQVTSSKVVPAARPEATVDLASTSTPASAGQRSQQLAGAERLRRMGVIGDTSDGGLDLDEVLRQRRSAS